MTNSGLRGLAYNDPALTLPFSLSGQISKVSWSYNWYSYPYTPGQAQPQPPNSPTYNPAIAFTPMLWSTHPDLTSGWASNVAASRTNFGTTAVIAFNEPDLCIEGSSCMNVTAAVEGWKTWIDPLKGQVKLGAPGVSNSAQPGQGLNWLQSFLGQCSDCTIDFVPVHWYGDAGDVEGFKIFVKKAFGTVNAPTVGGVAAKGRKLWVTEFGTTSGSREQTTNFLKSAMAWMDGEGKMMVERYAWFMDRPGNLITDDAKGLSELGKLYNAG